MDTSIPDWTTLPKDLLIFIANHLLHYSLVDFLRFRAICHSFRASAPYPPKPPVNKFAFQILINKNSNPGHFRNFLLIESTVYAFQPLETISNTRKRTTTWLLNLEHLNSGKLRTREPFLGNRFTIFSNNLPMSLNLLDYQVQEITKAYRLELADDHRLDCFKKVAVSTDGFEIMVITRASEGFLWRNGDEEWTSIGNVYDRFADIAYHNSMFYVLNDLGVTRILDLKSFRVVKVLQPPRHYSQDFYLVKSFKELFLIVKYKKWMIFNSVKIYKLDEEKYKWVEAMDGLKEQAFIVGGEYSFSFSTKDFPGCKGNCVYFLSNITGSHGLQSKFEIIDL